jgi:hypothetical protein
VYIAVRDKHPHLRAASKAARGVPVAVLALTSQLLQESWPVTPELTFVDSPTVDEFISRLGVGCMTQLSARYGPTPFDWHPFGTDETIGMIVEQLLSDPESGINSKLGALKQPQAPVRWERVDAVTRPSVV